MNKSSITVWLLFFLMVFAVGVLITHAAYTLAMKDLVIRENTGLTTLKVKEVPKGTLQTDQYTPIQGAVNPIGKEL